MFKLVFDNHKHIKPLDIGLLKDNVKLLFLQFYINGVDKFKNYLKNGKRKA